MNIQQFNQITKLILSIQETPKPNTFSTFVDMSGGKYGSVSFTRVLLDENLNAKSCFGHHQVMWTDHSTIEPYNRQGPEYCQGASFENMIQTFNSPEYREFESKTAGPAGMSISLREPYHNNAWNYGTFSFFCSSENKELFLTQLRTILNKPHPFK